MMRLTSLLLSLALVGGYFYVMMGRGNDVVGAEVLGSGVEAVQIPTNAAQLKQLQDDLNTMIETRVDNMNAIVEGTAEPQKP